MEALKLSDHSMKYFKPEFMSLTRPHTLWSSCGSNPFEVHKAVVQAKMLSGTYITDKLARHRTPNSLGLCSIPGCTGQDVGSLEHILLTCPALSESRNKIVKLCHTVADEHVDIKNILHHSLNQTTSKVVQFLLDCSSLPQVILLKQKHETNIINRLFYLTRSWCYAIHRCRMNKLGLFHYR